MADHAIHISEEEAARDFAGVLARVREGAEVVIESDARPVAIVRPAGDEFRPRLLSESIALAKEHAEKLGYEPRMDPDFANDLEEIARNRRPWNPVRMGVGLDSSVLIAGERRPWIRPFRAISSLP